MTAAGKEAGMERHRSVVTEGGTLTPLCIELLVGRLQAADGAERKRAREALMHIGRLASPAVQTLLRHPSDSVRWEACKTLMHLRDPVSARALARMLTDEDMDVRWVAADALIELERHAVEPVLELLREEYDTVTLREGAHHVLHALRMDGLLNGAEERVLEALAVNELPSKAAFAAVQVLDERRRRREEPEHHVTA
ncbi:MAG: HEAT repeat domain-containing protein [Bacteroidetes bacterium]|nr:MAG: HEAT repeat domain-containing protein [Bacteroidota bacterium]